MSAGHMPKQTKAMVKCASKALVTAALMSLIAGAAPRGAAADTFAIDFVTAVGHGTLLGEDGTVVGTETTRGVCPRPYPQCYGSSQIMVWPGDGSQPMALPAPAGTPFLAPVGMNNHGWIAGTASEFSVDFRPQSVVWKPNGVNYTIEELGLLPGNTIARVAGIDDFNRIVGYNTITNILAPDAAPFVWTPTAGLRDLTDQGFPNEIPLDVSPKGTVALLRSWFRLDVPGVVTPNAALPVGFVAVNAGAVINDAGDQGRFLLTSGSEGLAYLHRYVARTAQWQLLSNAGTGHLARFGLGSIDKARNISATVLGTGVFAPGRNGVAQSLAAQLSPAYGGIAITNAGPRNSSGVIVANAGLGRSSTRLVKLVPVSPCAASCVRVVALEMTARSVSSCRSTNVVTAELSVTDESGAPLSGVTLKGRFLDDYYLNAKISGVSSSEGKVRFVHRGPACVGAIAFFVDAAKASGRTFDRTLGQLTNFIIPPL